jgi:hypothetical protein
MQIFVKLTDRTIILDTGIDSDIATIKQQIHDKVGIPPDHQRLVFAGKSLKDLNTLTDYNITDHSTIYLTLSLCNGS